MNDKCKAAVARAAEYVELWYERDRMSVMFYTDLAYLLDAETIDPVIDSLPPDVRSMFIARLREHIGDASAPLDTYEYRMSGTITPGMEAEFEAWRQAQSHKFNNVVVPAVRAWLTRHPEAR